MAKKGALRTLRAVTEGDNEHMEHVPYQARAKRGSREGLTEAAVTGINLDSLGSAEILQISSLNVDGEYQRDLRHDLVNQIAKEYDIVKAGPILVSSREDGTLWVVDGQHRLAGAEQSGETEIFAHVVHGLSQAEEASLRLARNNRRGDSIMEKFRTRLVMGDPKIESIIEIAGQQGTELNFTASKWSGINALATVELLYDIDSKGVWLARVLRCIRESFSNLEQPMTPDTCSTSMLKAVGWFLGQHVDNREVSYSEFVSRLGAAGVEDVRRKAVSHKAANGGALWLNYYRALVEVWNFRRTEKQKIRWKTTGSIAKLGAAGTRTEAWRKEGV